MTGLPRQTMIGMRTAAGTTVTGIDWSFDGLDVGEVRANVTLVVESFYQ
jgi:hypothetical protein